MDHHSPDDMEFGLELGKQDRVRSKSPQELLKVRADISGNQEREVEPKERVGGHQGRAERRRCQRSPVSEGCCLLGCGLGPQREGQQKQEKRSW